MESWNAMASDYCRAHRGEVIRTMDLAEYFGKTSTRTYGVSATRTRAHKCLSRLAKEERIEKLGRAPDGYHGSTWGIPEGFE